MNQKRDSSGNPLKESPLYPISIKSKPTYPSQLPPGGGVENFDTPAAAQLNRARINHLASLNLTMRGKRVLDVGCGVGHLAQFFVKQGCDLLCVDARQENIERLRQLYPDVRAQLFDLEADQISELGSFEIVFVYGILYHLENPFRALRSIASVCKEILLIETVVLDHYLPLLQMCEETSSYTQALHNIGSRPTPSFIALALRVTGFIHIYAPITPPDHPDFRFSWKNDLSHSRDGHLIRCVFVAARSPLNNPALVPLLGNSELVTQAS